MRIIKDHQVTEDAWELLCEPPTDAPLAAGDVIVPLAWWREHCTTPTARAGRLGVLLQGGDELEEVVAKLLTLPLLALDFPKFADGRCYSLARLLRERYGYRGELRAVGDVQYDQLLFMLRCGIDSFALRLDRDPQQALRAFEEISVRYQAAADGAPPLYRYR